MKFNDYWKIPKNIKEYFSPKRERQLKEKYGKLYTLHTILSIVILLLPFLVFIFLIPTSAFEATTKLGDLLSFLGFTLGFIGSLAIGIGFANIFMAIIKQYLGHFVTLIAMAIGIALDMLGLFLYSLVK